MSSHQPEQPPLESLKLPELYQIAWDYARQRVVSEEAAIAGLAQLKRDELIAYIRMVRAVIDCR